MSTRPVIFISAVSRELHSARQLVANTLTFLGYEPDWQDIFGSETGDLRAMLRRRVDASQGVVQIIGQCYGAEPPVPDEPFGRCSYTQYEALYAHQRGRKVWYLFVDENFPADPHEPETEEKRALQAAYRRRVCQSNQLYRFHQDTRDLENSVLKLRDDLASLRRGVRQWAALVLVLLVVCAGSAIWLLKRGNDTQEQIEKAQADLKAVRNEIVALRQGVLSYATTESRIKEQDPKLNPEQLQAKTYTALAEQLGLDAQLLRDKLPAFAAQLRRAPDATTYERANAAYVAKEYAEAERLALQAAYEAETAKPPRIAEAILARQLAGDSAGAAIHYADALKHYQAAAAFTDRQRDPMDWAGRQWKIAHALDDLGRDREAEAVYREVLAEYQKKYGSDDANVLPIRNNLATLLASQGRDREAEKEHRAILAIRERVLGPDHLHTMSSRHNLAESLQNQGKYAEAVAEYRQSIETMTRVLGPEHENTLASRSGLANALDGLGDYAASEKEHRAVLAIRTRVLGPDHPDTLASRTNIANLLEKQDRHAEAEKEFRETIAMSERVLGPEHPETLSIRSNFTVTLRSLGKLAESEEEERKVLAIRMRVLGPDHPDTLRSRSKIAVALDVAGKTAEAEREFREVLEAQQRVLGNAHPQTFATWHNFAVFLFTHSRFAEAEQAHREVLAIRLQVLGAEHPETIDSRLGLARALQRQAKFLEAEKELRLGIAALEKRPPQYDLYESYAGLAMVLASIGNGAEALSFARRAEDGVRKLLGNDHPTTGNAILLRQQIENLFPNR